MPMLTRGTEKSGSKLYVPVESTRQPENDIPPMQPSDEAMQVDDSKHKVYIYDLDAELSDESDAEGEGKLVFLPDIERHLKENRIPPAVLANDDGELAGMQVVLYSDPKSLSVSEKHDGVRKAILQARHRLREKQRAEVNGETNTTESAAGTASPADDAMDMD